PPAPEQRQHHEHATVRRVHAAEVRRLERGHHAVEEQDEPAEGAEQERPALAQPQPDQVPATDLEQTRQAEQRDRFPDRRRAHEALLTRVPARPPFSTAASSSSSASFTRQYRNRPSRARSITPAAWSSLRWCESVDGAMSTNSARSPTLQLARSSTQSRARSRGWHATARPSNARTIVSRCG